ncbi:MAG: hypothetical protein QM752_07590 [Gammaproteobacteria bacterium]
MKPQDKSGIKDPNLGQNKNQPNKPQSPGQQQDQSSFKKGQLNQ